jgi:spore coat polysaccharide biosynthesis protein SpsF (cytidylyltransferase family)
MALTLGGTTLLERAWRQACGVFGRANVIIATHLGDDAIFDIIPTRAQHFTAFTPAEDVLGRFWQCVDAHDAFDRLIVRWTPDDWRKDDWQIRRAVRGSLFPSVAESVEVIPGMMLDRLHWETPWSRREHIGDLLPCRPAPPDDGLPWSIDTQDDYDRVVAEVGA